MNWANLGGGGFSFGPLSAVQQGLYEDQPDLAYQRLMQHWGQGTPGFESTVLGRYLASQQRNLFSQYTNKAAENPMSGLTWTKYLEDNASNTAGQFGQLPGYMRGSNPGLYRVRREIW